MNYSLDHNLNSLLKVASFKPSSVQPPAPWVGHLPFASWLIQLIKPRIFVELGTHSGNSYFTFCETVKNAELNTKCFAVDTWQGDEHAGFYDDEVFGQVFANNQSNYAEFSNLMRMTFDDAANSFSDGSIDLLHIDGLHSFDAVKHDFETWLPKLAGGAIVILHDTSERQEGFGVWRFWESLQSKYACNMEFTHSHGLGVVQIFDAENTEKKFHLFDMSAEEKQQLTSYFAALGNGHQCGFELGVTKGILSDRNQKLLETEDKLRTSDHTLEVRDQKIEYFEQENTNLNKIIVHLNGEASELSDEIDRLNGEVSHLQAVIDAIHMSRSWRLLGPFRRLRALVKYLK